MFYPKHGKPELNNLIIAVSDILVNSLGFVPDESRRFIWQFSPQAHQGSENYCRNNLVPVMIIQILLKCKEFNNS